MKQNKIYPQEWVAFHPYSKADSTDAYYAKVASEVYTLLRISEFKQYVDSEGLRRMACFLTAYLEDVVSGTGIWRAFTSECRKLYGKPLPFYAINEKEYYDDEINLPDVRFLLWNYFQHFRTQSVVNPENPFIEETAQAIYELFEEEYEFAPENVGMQFFLSPDADYSLFYHYKELLEWFHFNCFLNFGNMTHYMDSMEETRAEAEWEDENDEIYSYDLKVKHCFEHRNRLLAYTSPEWLCRIFGTDQPYHDCFNKVKYSPTSLYAYQRTDDSYVYVIELTDRQRRELAIDKRSIRPFSNIQKGQIIICSLVFYNETFWQCGALSYGNRFEKDIDTETLNNELDRAKNENLAMYNDFIQASGGGRLLYFGSKEEMLTFCSTKMNYSWPEEPEIPFEARNSFALIASKQNGWGVLFYGLKAIKDPRNPFYSAEDADKVALNFFVTPGFCPVEITCYLIKNGYLPDARLNSLHGAEHGRKLLMDNWDFYIRYYLREVPPTDS